MKIRRENNCIDEVIIHILNNRKIDVEPIFTENWYFDFVDNNNNVLNNISYESSDKFELLNTIYNIEVECLSFGNKNDVYNISKYLDDIKYSNKKTKELIRNSLENKDISICIEFDTYYAKWDNLYKKIHGTHMAIIESIDDNYIYIYDPWYKVNEKISYSFLYDNVYKVIILNFGHLNTKKIDSNYCISKFMDNFIEKNSFSNLDKFKNSICNLDFSEEIKKIDNINYTKSYIFKVLTRIAHSRKQCSEFLKYCFKIDGNYKFNEVMRGFENLSLMWNNLKFTIIKEVINPHTENIKNIQELTDKITEEEIRLFNCLKKIDSQKSVIKCVAWDLDNTIWEGTIDNNDNVKLKKGVLDLFNELQRQGIPSVVISKNNYKFAMEQLTKFNLEKYFLEFKISWNDKYTAIQEISDSLNISLNSILFIDDSEFELLQCNLFLPEVQTLHADKFLELQNIIQSDYTTQEGSKRIELYRSIIQRNEIEKTMDKESFLQLCEIDIKIDVAKDEHFERIIELSERTNQFNLSNKILIKNELSKYNFKYICSMKDIFADYGIVGSIIGNVENNVLNIAFFTVSCKVEGRNIGSHMIDFIIESAKSDGVSSINAKYKNNRKNKRLTSLFVFKGFKLSNKRDSFVLNIDKKNKSDKCYSLATTDNLNTINKVISDILNRNVSYNEEFDQEISSLDFVNLIVKLETIFEINIEVSDIYIKDFNTTKKINKFIEKVLNQ